MSSATEVRARKRVLRLIRVGLLPELLEEQGLLQSDVATFVGVDPSQVSRWLSGDQKPRPHHAARLLELLEAE